MKVFILRCRWNVYGDTGNDIIAVYMEENMAKCAFDDFLKKEQKESWLNDVLDENLAPLVDAPLAEYELQDYSFEAYHDNGECFTSVWIEVFVVK